MSKHNSQKFRIFILMKIVLITVFSLSLTANDRHNDVLPTKKNIAKLIVEIDNHLDDVDDDIELLINHQEPEYRITALASMKELKASAARLDKLIKRYVIYPSNLPTLALRKILNLKKVKIPDRGKSERIMVTSRNRYGLVTIENRNESSAITLDFIKIVTRNKITKFLVRKGSNIEFPARSPISFNIEDVFGVRRVAILSITVGIKRLEGRNKGTCKGVKVWLEKEH